MSRTCRPVTRPTNDGCHTTGHYPPIRRLPYGIGRRFEQASVQVPPFINQSGPGADRGDGPPSAQRWRIGPEPPFPGQGRNGDAAGGSVRRPWKRRIGRALSQRGDTGHAVSIAQSLTTQETGRGTAKGARDRGDTARNAGPIPPSRIHGIARRPPAGRPTRMMAPLPSVAGLRKTLTGYRGGRPASGYTRTENPARFLPESPAKRDRRRTA
jgi:hypothetical protein